MYTATVTTRVKRTALALGRDCSQAAGDISNIVLSTSTGSCSSTCCLGNDEAAFCEPDDKYSKRKHQRNRRLRDVIFFISILACLILYLRNRTSGDGRVARGIRLARQVAMPRHYDHKKLENSNEINQKQQTHTIEINNVRKKSNEMKETQDVKKENVESKEKRVEVTESPILVKQIDAKKTERVKNEKKDNHAEKEEVKRAEGGKNDNKKAVRGDQLRAGAQGHGGVRERRAPKKFFSAEGLKIHEAQKKKEEEEKRKKEEEQRKKRKEQEERLALWAKYSILDERHPELDEINERISLNNNSTIRWTDLRDVPPLPGQDGHSYLLLAQAKQPPFDTRTYVKEHKKFFMVNRSDSEMKWVQEFDAIVDKDPKARPNYVDYRHQKVLYPEKLMELPELGTYPHMRTFKEIYDIWPQDNLDNPPDVLQEDLIHFDWNNPSDLKAAVKFREAKLPFKVINVPELLRLTNKWTDEYLSIQFDTEGSTAYKFGKVTESEDNFFPFFFKPYWDINALGIPPTRTNNQTFAWWAKHARYADRVGLDPQLPHMYYQASTKPTEPKEPKKKWTFMSRDLPSFSSTEPNFILFHPELQEGIQCRFGERGVTAANHYDAGRNFVGIITGARRYILSPPRACGQLGMVTSKKHASYRHSMLNYGRISMMDREDMPQEEKEWLEIIGKAEAVSTIVKEGELLYIPAGWFHYITSLQKSAQCNVRSGNDLSGDEVWGGEKEVKEGCIPHK